MFPDTYVWSHFKQVYAGNNIGVILENDSLQLEMQHFCFDCILSHLLPDVLTVILGLFQACHDR